MMEPQSPLDNAEKNQSTGPKKSNEPVTARTRDERMSHLEDTLGDEESSDSASFSESKSKSASGILLATAIDGGTPTTRMQPALGLKGAQSLLNKTIARYDQLQELGSGGSALVISAHDSFFERDVAVKILHRKSKAGKQRIEKFLHEARMTAQLEHPNILPVFDMCTSDDGECYFTMRKAEGISLRDAIRSLVEEPDQRSAVSTFNDRINIFLKICDAVAYAHDKGIIHRDIKPDNIMLGKFGEVVVVDWGSAVTEEEARQQRNKLIGTPAYMAPEQARRDEATKSSDVYCLGSSLFHLLTLRHVMWSTNSDDFWAKKIRGHVDPINDAERVLIPPRLLAISEKAIAHDPKDRYASVLEMIEDLKNYQAGQGVSAYQDSTWDILKRWYRRNKKVFWVSNVAAVLIILAIFAWYNEKLKEQRSWRLFYAENFDQTDLAGLEQHWSVRYFNGWNMESNQVMEMSAADQQRVTIQDKTLALRGEFSNGCYNVGYKGSIGENISVEWDIIPSKGDTDFNCYIGGPWRGDAYIFHLAGHGSNKHVVLTRPSYKVFLDVYRFAEPLKIGQVYHLKMSKENNAVQFWINGVLAINYHDLDVLNGPSHQSFGFEMSTSDYRIDNIKAYTQPLPQKINPMAVPNGFFQEKMYAIALRQYQSLHNAYPNTDIAKEALLGIGRCYERLDKRDEASACYEQLIKENPEQEIAALALFDMLQNYAALDKFDEIIETAERMRAMPIGQSIKRPFFLVLQECIVSYYKLYGDEWKLQPNVKELVIEQIKSIIRYADGFGVAWEDRSAVRGLGDLLNDLGEHEMVLELMPKSGTNVAKALMSLQRYDELRKLFPDDMRLQINILLAEGKPEEAERRYPNNFYKIYPERLIAEGRYEEYRKLNDGNRGAEARLLNVTGNHQEVYKNYKDVRVEWLIAANSLRHYEEVIKANVTQYWQKAHAMHQLNRELELLGWPSYPRAAATRMTTNFRLAVKAMQNEKPEEAQKWIAELTMLPIANGIQTFCRDAFPVFMKHIGYGPIDAQACRENYRQLAADYKDKWANTRYAYCLFLSGDVDEEGFMKLVPATSHNELDNKERGIRAEAMGDIEAAIRIYKTELSEGSETDDFRIFAEWRIQVLKNQIKP